MMAQYRFSAPVWLYQAGKASWHFVTVPHEISEKIRNYVAGGTGAWGTVRVAVTIGQTCWKTSLFPDSKTGCFFLPLKAEVRRAESLAVDDTVTVMIQIGMTEGH